MFGFFTFMVRSQLKKRMQDGCSFANYKLFLDVTYCPTFQRREGSVTCNGNLVKFVRSRAKDIHMTWSVACLPIMVEIGKEMRNIPVFVRQETSFMYFKDAQMIFCASRTIIIIVIIITKATFCSFNSFQHSL